MFAVEECDRVIGENEATVGGLGSLLARDAASKSLDEVGVWFDIRSSQGVS